MAITRAKRHVALIANVETVSHDHTLKGTPPHIYFLVHSYGIAAMHIAYYM